MTAKVTTANSIVFTECVIVMKPGDLVYTFRQMTDCFYEPDIKTPNFGLHKNELGMVVTTTSKLDEYLDGPEVWEWALVLLSNRQQTGWIPTRELGLFEKFLYYIT